MTTKHERQRAIRAMCGKMSSLPSGSGKRSHAVSRARTRPPRWVWHWSFPGTFNICDRVDVAGCSMDGRQSRRRAGIDQVHVTRHE